MVSARQQCWGQHGLNVGGFLQPNHNLSIFSQPFGSKWQLLGYISWRSWWNRSMLWPESQRLRVEALLGPSVNSLSYTVMAAGGIWRLLLFLESFQTYPVMVRTIAIKALLRGARYYLFASNWLLLIHGEIITDDLLDFDVIIQKVQRDVHASEVHHIGIYIWPSPS